MNKPTFRERIEEIIIEVELLREKLCEHAINEPAADKIIRARGKKVEHLIDLISDICVAVVGEKEGTSKSWTEQYFYQNCRNNLRSEQLSKLQSLIKD